MTNGILVVFLVIIAIGLIKLGLSNTENMKEQYAKAVTMIVFLTGLAVGFVSIGKNIGHRQGQIDALTNNVRYKLVTMPDSTKVWERIGEKE